ncbi:aldose epimerase [Paraburkholderia sp. Ac-20340]|uniref:aldose epimerase family protein n=1 Tax=Paraburkholderia sp. Ac-20340 TaxID=2703888 RepID=UPI00197F8079|nr:aldose epimerase [Paraburkholderia sp. Ac-20340]MBN3854186.1 aldose epimerase [Paraburkholderia sp. Ac-20340]
MPKFQDQEVIEIVRGGSRLLLAPQAGGRLLSWHLHGASIIHWPDAADWTQPALVRGGNPLLFPFIARHRVDGRIGFWRDAQGVVREVPLHGFARDLPFAAQVDEDGASVRMTLKDSAATQAGYPFRFRFEAVYRLVDEATLEVSLITTNTAEVSDAKDSSDARMPYYAGHHFYFALPHTQRGEATLTLPRNVYRHQLADGTTTEPQAGATRYAFDDPQIVDRFHCIEGEPETPVRIDIPTLNRSIEIDLKRPDSLPWYAVTSWTLAPDADFYCVEPWLGLPDAIHNGLGLRWLAPGQSETATLRIAVSALR